jgi:RHS repeat-associated protein
VISSAFLTTSRVNSYLYSGKEIDRMHGLNEYDFSARWQDAAQPGFTTMDPLVEIHPWESPYMYCGGDPVNRTDPTGMLDKPYLPLNNQNLGGVDVHPEYTPNDVNAALFSNDHSNPNGGTPLMDGYSGNWNDQFSGGSPVQTSPVNTDKVLNKGEIADKASSEPSLGDMKKNPPSHPNYKSPKKGDRKVRNPNGQGSGWESEDGDVWVPTDHKGNHAPHWDRQHPDGTHTNVYPSTEQMIIGAGVVIGAGIIIITDGAAAPFIFAL